MSKKARTKRPTISRTFAVLLVGITVAACDGKSSPTKENFANAVQTYLDSKDAVCIFTGAVPFDAARYSFEERSAEPLVKLGLLTKEATSAQDDGSAHRMVPGYHYALTDEGKRSYRPANPAKESKICGGKSKLLAIAQVTSASEKPNVGDRVFVRYEAKLVDRPRWDDEAVLRPVHVEVLSTENDQYRGEYFLELTSGGWVVNPSLL